MKSLYIQINTDDGIPLQPHRRGTSLNGIGHELIKKILIDRNSFVTVGFVCIRYRSTVTDGVSRQIHLTRDFSHARCTCDHTLIVAQGVLGAHSFHPHAIHDVIRLVLVLSLFS